MHAIPRTYPAGTTLFVDGETSVSLFIIRKGTVSIRKGPPNAYVEISKLFTNEVLGELSFFDRSPRSATAVALTDVPGETPPHAPWEKSGKAPRY